MVTFDDVKNNAQVKALIDSSSKVLAAMNYTEHGVRHAGYVSSTAYNILKELGYDQRTCELARIAGYIHDIGNSISRTNHGITSGTLMYPILVEMGMPLDEVCMIISAVGNHEEEIGFIINELSAALVIADKSDAHRTRVHQNNHDKSDIHDRVNYAIKKNIVVIDKATREISSKFYMDETSSVMEYFQIYLKRIQMSEKAAHYIDCTFKLYINDVLINSPKPLKGIY